MTARISGRWQRRRNFEAFARRTTDERRAGYLQQIDDWVTDDVSRAIPMIDALNRQPTGAGSDRVKGVTAGVVACVAHSASNDVVPVLGELLNDRPVRGPALPRTLWPMLAMRFVYRQSPSTIDELLAEPAIADSAPELGFWIVHESLVRHGSVGPSAPTFVEWAAATSHPCSWLPTYLSEMEEDLSELQPKFSSPRGSSGPCYLRMTSPGDVALSTILDPAQGRLGTLDDQHLSATAFDTAWFHGFSTAEAADDTAHWRDVFGDDTTATAVEPDRIIDILFAAASCGGPYSRHRLACDARLATWRSVAGIIGLRGTEPFAEVERRARETEWFEIDCTSDWFYHVAWDSALGCTTPDGVTSAVAATATD